MEILKIMQINCVYKKGSTGKIVYDLHCCMKKEGNESVVCYGRGEKITEDNVYKSCCELYSKVNNLLSRITGIMYGGCILSTINLIRIIKREKPDIVHVHCINGYFVNIYRFITYLKKQHIRTVLTQHAEFMYTANCGYALECNKWETGCGDCPRLRMETKSFLIDNTGVSWKKMKQAFEGFNSLIVVSVSPWLKARAQRSPILGNHNHVTVLNGIDTGVFKLHDTTSLKKKMGLENKKIVFHVTSAFSLNKEHIKGGYYVIEIAKKFLAIDRDVIFLVAGRSESISDLPSNVIFLGNIDNQETLANYYSMADVTLLASKKETFSMVVAESLCCGTPVVGFEAGAPEMITIKDFSTFVPHGNVNKLFDQVNCWLNNTKFKKEEISQKAIKKYGKEEMVREYQKIYDSLLRNKE